METNTREPIDFEPDHRLRSARRQTTVILVILVSRQASISHRHWAIRLWFLLCALLAMGGARAQQYNSDNQWTAPHGVGTFIATVGQRYSALLGVAALYPHTEFNLGITRYEGDSSANTEAHYSGIFYVKRTMWENEAGTGGWSLSGGTGLSPSYLNQGEVTDTFRSWFVTAAITFPFRDGDISWDLLPGVSANFDKDLSGEHAYNATYSSRVAVYKIIPHSAIVAEVFGTTGEAHAEPQYRAGVRWESPKFIMALTYGKAFNGDEGPRWEFGIMMFSDPVKAFCWGKKPC